MPTVNLHKKENTNLRSIKLKFERDLEMLAAYVRRDTLRLDRSSTVRPKGVSNDIYRRCF